MLNKENVSTRSVIRIFEILQLLANHPDGLTLKQIVDGLHRPPKSSVHSLLQQMVNLRYIAYLESDKKYKIGSGMVKLSATIMARHTIQHHARPGLEKLSRMSGEDAYLGIIHDDGLYYIDKVEGDASVRLNIAVGVRRYLHSSCIGKLFLAYMNEDEQKRLIEKTGMPKVAKNTITEWSRFRDELQKIREQGYAITDEESVDGVIGIAAPIRNHKDEIVAGICISAAVTRVMHRKDELIRMVLDVSKEIGEQLGNHRS